MSLKFINKWRTILTASIIVMMAVVFSGCDNMNNFKAEKTKDKTTEDIAYLKVTAQVDSSGARTVLPSFSNTTSISSFQFTIQGKTGSETEFHALTDSANQSDVYSSLADLEAATFPLTSGTWTFKLSAEKNGTKLSSDETEKTIQINEDNTVTFLLKWLADADNLSGYGDFVLTLDYSGVPNKADVKVVTGQLYSYDPADGSETVLTGNDYEEWSIPLGTNCKVSYSLVHLRSGYYRIKIRFYADTAKQNLINTYPELVIITGGQESKANRSLDSLNQVYSINWNNITGINESITFPEIFTKFSSFALPTGLTKTGYTFGGWYTDASCSGAVITDISEGTTGDLSIYAKWIPNADTAYIVKHWKQTVTGGDEQNDTNYTCADSDQVENKTGTTDDTTAATAKDTSTGSFAGFVAPSATELAAAQTTIAPDGTTVVNLYYRRQYSTITYNDGVDDETITVPDVSTWRYGKTANIDFTTPMTRAGYTFTGWKDNRTGTIYTSEGTTSFEMGLFAVELTAQWTIVNYNISYTSSIGTFTIETNPVTYNILSNFTLVPPEDGGDARFDGWFDNDGNKVESITPGCTGDLPLTAIWTLPYAKINDTNYYSKAELIEAIEAATGDITIELTGRVTGSDLGPSATTGTILNAIRGLNVDQFSANANISLTIPTTANIHITDTISANMFDSCYALVTADLKGLNTSVITDMSNMFYYCQNLTSLNLYGWDTSSVTTMKRMFYNTYDLTMLDISSFDTGNVTDMSEMFQSVGEDLSTGVYAMIIVSAKFVTTNVSDGSYIFRHCQLQGGNGTTLDKSATTNNDISFAHVDGGTSSPGYFTEKPYIAKVGNNFYYTLEDVILAIGNSRNTLDVILGQAATAEMIGTSSTSDTIIYAIKTICGASSVNLSVEYGVYITLGTSMANMFNGCDKLASVNLNGFDASAVTSMENMFQDCSNLVSVDLGGLASNDGVTSLSNMFNMCSELTKINLAGIINESVTSVKSMFSYCTCIEEIDFGDCDFKSVTDFEDMFGHCYQLKSVRLPASANSAPTNMKDMFTDCWALLTVDLKRFAPAAAVNTENMFSGCSELTKIFADFTINPADATSTTDMFSGCNNLSGGSSTSWASGNANDGTYAKPDGGIDTPGYFTSTTYYARVGNAYYINKEDTISAIGNEDGDIEVVLYNGVSGAELGISNDQFEDTIAKAIKETPADSVRIIIDRNAHIEIAGSAYVGMFGSCDKLVYADLRGLDCSSATSLSLAYMFQGCSKLKKVNLSGLNTSQLSVIGYMFQNCRDLDEVDLSGWDFSNVNTTTSMFEGCENLRTIYSTNDFSSSVSEDSMTFYECPVLKGGSGTDFVSTNETFSDYGRIDDPVHGKPGYFTYREAPPAP